MTVQEAQQYVRDRLHTIYDGREAVNIADWVMEHLTGYGKVDRLVHRQQELAQEKIQLLERYTGELLAHKPVQYVLHEAWFCGLKLYVDENVLIPRPETEELVEWIARHTAKKILDVGTGSGCIPIALKKKFPQSEIYACDVSDKALTVATGNAAAHNASINFIQADFLNKSSWPSLPEVDILVSNPPYVPQKDKHSMSENVLRYEPHLALFVQDDNPLIFYNALAEFAQTHLLPGGSVYVEIHEDLGTRVQQLFSAKGFAPASLRKDMQGKDRMVRAFRQ